MDGDEIIPYTLHAKDVEGGIDEWEYSEAIVCFGPFHRQSQILRKEVNFWQIIKLTDSSSFLPQTNE